MESRAQVLPLVQKLVPAGSSVSHGGSETLKEVGVIDLLSGGDYQYINRAGLEGEALRQCYQDAFGCDAYFTSSNAITTDGVLYNVGRQLQPGGLHCVRSPPGDYDRGAQQDRRYL